MSRTTVRGDGRVATLWRGPHPGAGYDSAVAIDNDALGGLLDEIGIGLELNSAGPAIEPLLAALIGDAPPAALRAAAVGAVEAFWDAELEHEVRVELEGFRAEVVGEGPALVSRIDSALRGLVEPSAHNQVAHVLVWGAAAKLCVGRAATTSGGPSSSGPWQASAFDAADRRGREPRGGRR